MSHPSIISMTDTESEKTTTDKMLEGAFAEAQKWLDAFTFDPDKRVRDVDGVHDELMKRIYKDEPVLAFVGRNARETKIAVVYGGHAYRCLKALNLIAHYNRGKEHTPVLSQGSKTSLACALHFCAKSVERLDPEPTFLMELHRQFMKQIGLTPELVGVFNPTDAQFAAYDWGMYYDRFKKECEGLMKLLKEAYQTCWDYYLMAFYHSAISQVEIDDEFGNQSFLEAFKKGIGLYVNMGSLGVGCLLPEEAHLDEERRLHREHGPAIVWGGTEQYWWRGTRVEKDWIMEPDSIDPKLGLTHENIELRRVICEIVGWTKVLDGVEFKVIDMDDDPHVGELIEVDLPDIGAARYLRVLCPTGRLFTICVPFKDERDDRDIDTALHANAWSNHKTPEDFRPSVQT